MTVENLETTIGKEEISHLTAQFFGELMQQKPHDVVTNWDKNDRLAQVLPELTNLKGVPQRPDYHLEGDVWTHTLRVLEHLPLNASLELKLAALFHDIGKAETTVVNPDGQITSYDHQAKGVEMVRKILGRFNAHFPRIQVNEEKIEWLVKFHLMGQGSGGELLREATVRRYFLRSDGWGQELLTLITADTLGRDAVRGDKDKMATLDATIARIAEIRTLDKREPTPPLPLPNGQEIMKLFGLSPSPAVGQIKQELSGIYQRLGFTEKSAGMRVASILHDHLVLKSVTKTIPDEKLKTAVQATLRHFLSEMSGLRLGQEIVSVFVSSEETPWFKKEVPGEWVKFQLHRSEARFLENKQIRILAIGPPRSGKTSFVHSLSQYLRELCQDLPFQLETEAVDLDKSRADLTRLMARESVFPKKLRWTAPLAQSARKDFRPRLSNIVLGDGPGGVPDEITKIISQPANCAILVVSGGNDEIYRLRRETYLTFLDSQSIPVIAEFRTRPHGQRQESGEEITSQLRVFRPRNFLGGQIVGLEFGQDNRDPVIADVARIFLFNLFPALARGNLGK